MSNYVKATNFATKDTLPTGDSNKIVKGTEIDNEFNAIAGAVSSKADLSSPTFTGTPSAPTATSGSNTTQIANTAYVTAERTAVATLTNKTLTSPAIEGSIVFEGATADDFETTLTVTDPTDDRTITLPNDSGTVALTSQLASPAALFTSSGTYSIAGTTSLVITASAHGRAVDDVVYLDFTSGGLTDGYYTVTAVTTDTLTVTYGSSTTASGNVTGYYSNLGTIALASEVEALAGTNNSRVITPKSLDTVLDTRFSVEGTAPSFLARAWVYFNGSVDADKSGSWTRTDTTVTVTMVNHGFIVGNRGYLNFNATVADGVYEITSVADANTFTVTSATSGTASGTVISQQQTIYRDGNVSVVSRQGTGDYLINFAQPMPSEYYGFSFVSSSAQIGIDTGNLPSTGGFRIQCTNSAGTATDGAYISAIVVG
jgi:hypothetical protein